MDCDVVGEELIRFGLNVKDIHLAKALDRDDLLLAQVGAALRVAKSERPQQLALLLVSNEADQLGEPRALRADRDRDLVEVMAVVLRFSASKLAPRVDPERSQEELNVLGPALADHRESDTCVLIVAVPAHRHIAVGLEEASQVSRDLRACDDVKSSNT